MSGRSRAVSTEGDDGIFAVDKILKKLRNGSEKGNMSVRPRKIEKRSSQMQPD